MSIDLKAIVQRVVAKHYTSGQAPQAPDMEIARQVAEAVYDEVLGHKYVSGMNGIKEYYDVHAEIIEDLKRDLLGPETAAPKG